MRSARPSPRAPLGLAVAAGLSVAACNLIFGIEPGEPQAATTGGGATSSSTTASSSEASSTSTTSTSTTSTSTSSTGTGAGGGCGIDAGAPVGTAYQIRVTDAVGLDGATAAAFDASDHLVMVGSFNDASINLGGGDLPHAPNGDLAESNVFVAKYDPTDKYEWGLVFGGDRSAYPLATAVAPNGDVWVTGAFWGSLTIGATTLDYATAPDADYEDLFVAKLDKDGNVVWAKRFGNEFIQIGMGLAVDSAGNAYLAGAGWDTMDFGLGPFGQGGEWSSFVVKLAPDGTPIWQQWLLHWNNAFAFYPTPNREVSVAVDRDDDVLLAAHFDAQTFFDGQVQAPFGGSDAYVIKLDGANGSFVWKSFIHGPAGNDGDQWITSIAADPCTKEVYVAGGFRGAIEIAGVGSATVTLGDPNEDDMFLLKLGPDGAPAWLRTFGDTGVQRANRVGVDPGGSVVMTGVLRGAPGYQGVDFGPTIGVLGPQVPSDPADGGADYNDDLFVAKFDADGNGLWGRRLGDEGHQGGWDVVFDRSGNIGLAGQYHGSVQFPGLPVYTANYFDAFAVWLVP